ncbi:MAG: hypothetical protein CMB80_00380 [Flammeovirgaceae bacterium]|nr:hypothetical protein [Flammeovirgaceae bacterium]
MIIEVHVNDEKNGDSWEEPELSRVLNLSKIIPQIGSSISCYRDGDTHNVLEVNYFWNDIDELFVTIWIEK